MSNDDLLRAALALPPRDRRRFAGELLRSLAEDVDESTWNQAWGAELDRRLERLRDGEEGVDFDDLLQVLGSAGGREAS